MDHHNDAAQSSGAAFHDLIASRSMSKIINKN